MTVVELALGRLVKAEILPLESSDYKRLSKTRYFFDWKKEMDQESYKLLIAGEKDIQGLVSVERIPDEWRIHIRLLTVSRENKGQGKKYDKIIGNLLTYIGKIALMEHGEMACISLRPKSAIARHYIEKYNMKVTGLTLSLEMQEIIHLINQFDHDQ